MEVSSGNRGIICESGWMKMVIGLGGGSNGFLIHLLNPSSSIVLNKVSLEGISYLRIVW
jgi:hypothetical protein